MKTPRPFIKFGIFASLILILGAFTSQIAVMQGTAPGSFPQTGHTISDEFLAFYEKVPNPELVYGYPITERISSTDGLVVQYFQKARFELHPERPEDQRVQLTPLGQKTYKPGTPFVITKNLANCQTFDTGFDVCYSFLEFFTKYGKATQFGQPISSVEERDGRLVQYFEYARLEWHPDSKEAGLNQEVQLTYLGRQYFDQLGEDPALLRPTEIGNSEVEIISVEVHAFPVQAVVSEGEMQALYVIVQDQNLNFIPGMNVTLNLTYPNGTTTALTLPPTNEHGYTSVAIPFDPVQNGVGIAEIGVTAFNPTFEATTRSSFRIAP